LKKKSAWLFFFLFLSIIIKIKKKKKNTFYAEKKKEMYGSKYQVYKGSRTKTQGGLKKKDIVKVCKNGRNRYVSRKKNAAGKKNNWINSVKKARKELKIKGFVAITKKSTLYKLSRKIYDECHPKATSSKKKSATKKKKKKTTTKKKKR
jgi:hypothetical protein